MRQLNTDRGLLKLILLSFITCGIYELIFIHSLAADVNEACREDGKHTTGLLGLLLLSLITCGIYSLVASICNLTFDPAKEKNIGYFKA